MESESYAYFCTLKNTTFAEAKEKVVQALSKEGFGVLTEIDMQATLKEKLNVTFRNYLILGVCNPGLAHSSLGAFPHAGLFLPCNVVIQGRTESEGIMVSMQNPSALSAIAGNPELDSIAHEADLHMRNVLVALGGTLPVGKSTTLDDLLPRQPEAYPGQGLRTRLDARQVQLEEIKHHSPSKGLEI